MKRYTSLTRFVCEKPVTVDVNPEECSPNDPEGIALTMALDEAMEADISEFTIANQLESQILNITDY